LIGIGETQQPRSCAASLFERTRTHRHADRSRKGGV